VEGFVPSVESGDLSPINKVNIEKGEGRACYLLEVVQSENKGYFGKEGMHEEHDSWKEEQHARMHGRPNDVKVRVFAIYCNV
jgi:hypothetical protein